MKVSAIVFLFLFCYSQTVAQKLVFHAGGGLSSHYGASSKMTGAFNIGGSIEWELSQRWTIEPGVLYYAKGWKDHEQTVTVYDDQGNVVYDNDGNLRTAKMGKAYRANYLVVPMQFHYYIPLTLPHYVYLSAGPYVAYGIGGKARISGDTSQVGAARFYYDGKTFGHDGIRRFDAGISMGIGYEFNRLINAGIEGDIGLTDVTPTGRKNLSIILTLGYRIPL